MSADTNAGVGVCQQLSQSSKPKPLSRPRNEEREGDARPREPHVQGLLPRAVELPAAVDGQLHGRLEERKAGRDGEELLALVVEIWGALPATRSGPFPCDARRGAGVGDEAIAGPDGPHLHKARSAVARLVAVHELEAGLGSPVGTIEGDPSTVDQGTEAVALAQLLALAVPLDLPVGGQPGVRQLARDRRCGSPTA